MNLLITGGTGFVGRAVVKQLISRRNSFQIVSRDSKNHSRDFVVQLPDPGKLFTSEVIARTSCIINLAGENIAGSRWNRDVREEILNSRVKVTSCIVNSILQNQKRGLDYPKVLINASAIGYYGSHPKQRFTESSGNGHGFLAEVCRAWEEEALRAESLGVRVLRLRFGHVLGMGGGMLPKVIFPFRFGVGGYIGDGQQWMSWIHYEDLVNLILQAVECEEWQGAYNACSPNAVTMKEFMKFLGRVLGSKSRTRIPAFLATVLFGDMAQEVLLKSQKVYPKRLLQQGYTFKYPCLFDALTNILKK
ncbi:TIGR01777 family oxidoreductase [Pelosinus propionicus]|uniref:TIGR01777 family protein n=1 Tax=Pelosinus propionicus DSM 13327 TaxID=1123291 RepID=A0A1I4MMV7_9FIRM|nr:TIGR01777 family oxidoreductase [Pelosinus propionicus]SFM04423.1 hypothetical protein SAMN04490355_103542 [Pelosinus propionicus DSM 13327]